MPAVMVPNPEQVRLGWTEQALTEWARPKEPTDLNFGAFVFLPLPWEAQGDLKQKSGVPTVFATARTRGFGTLGLGASG